MSSSFIIIFDGENLFTVNILQNLPSIPLYFGRKKGSISLRLQHFWTPNEVKNIFLSYFLNIPFPN